jgi:hypothetical protein
MSGYPLRPRKWSGAERMIIENFIRIIK